MSRASNQRKIEQYSAANLEAARIIAAAPSRYAGVMQEWARLVLQRDAAQTVPAARRATAA